MVGESLIDRVRRSDGHEEDLPGGSGANTAIALARLGRSVRLATCFAPDDSGDRLARHLSADGVALAGDPAAIPRTSSALAEIGPDHAATYTFDVEWALNPMTPLISAPVSVHVTSLAAVLEPGRRDTIALVENLRGSATITYDINARAAVTGAGPEVVERVEEMVGLSDIIKASDEDLETLWPHLDLDGAVWWLLSLGPTAVVVTKGAKGAAYRNAHHSGEVVAPEVEAVDTIGAGDTFSAALLDALAAQNLLGADRRGALAVADSSVWSAMLDWAVRAAAVTVGRPGADPPRRADLG